ncbi:MAG: hypothetical protein LBP67_09355 [Bacteroidales bacterium]|jgi:sugar O-acyltransferase (sialic acid O-acetyltransferase NeuD family)|nr:hypothetical protein [Bacteroidales bacterium]
MNKLKDIIFFGTGAVAAEITSYLESNNWLDDNQFQIKGYVASDDNGIINWEKYHYKYPYLGKLESYTIQSNDYFILALGNYKVKREIATHIKNNGGNFVSYVHPSVCIADSATIGVGNIIYPQIIIGPNVKLGDFNLLTSQSIISHDSSIGDYNFFATALLCGYNSVGDDNYFGIRATTLPSVEIGNRNIIQAGMIVDKNINDDTTIFYRYKEKIIAVTKE